MNLWFIAFNCFNCGCKVVQISHKVSDKFVSMQHCVCESPMLGCTAEPDDTQRSLQLERQICLEMWFRFLFSNWKNEDNLSLVWVDGPVNTELFLHSRFRCECPVQCVYRAGYLFCAHIIAWPALSCQGGGPVPCVVQLVRGFDMNLMRRQSWAVIDTCKVSFHEQHGLKWNTFLATTVLWHLV